MSASKSSKGYSGYSGKHADVYEQLEKFVYWLATNSQDPDMPGSMEFDDIVGELLLEMVKGLEYYKDMPRPRLIKLLKSMLDHRIGELRYKYYLTHRGLGRLALSLSVSADEDSDEDGFAETIPSEENVEDQCESNERIRQTRIRLSSTGLKVFDALIFGNRRLSQITAISAKRSEAVFKDSWGNRLKPWHLADALFLGEKDVKQALEEIHTVYNQVVKE